jgi:hypothetical protein
VPLPVFVPRLRESEAPSLRALGSLSRVPELTLLLQFVTQFYCDDYDSCDCDIVTCDCNLVEFGRVGQRDRREVPC